MLLYSMGALSSSVTSCHVAHAQQTEPPLTGNSSSSFIKNYIDSHGGCLVWNRLVESRTPGTLFGKKNIDWSESDFRELQRLLWKCIDDVSPSHRSDDLAYNEFLKRQLAAKITGFSSEAAQEKAVEEQRLATAKLRIQIQRDQQDAERARVAEQQYASAVQAEARVRALAQAKSDAEAQAQAQARTQSDAAAASQAKAQDQAQTQALNGPPSKENWAEIVAGSSSNPITQMDGWGGFTFSASRKETLSVLKNNYDQWNDQDFPLTINGITFSVNLTFSWIDYVKYFDGLSTISLRGRPVNGESLGGCIPERLVASLVQQYGTFNYKIERFTGSNTVGPHRGGV